ncbi:hypothetical protein [Methylococcus sp. EFPC2]|uniref:hypothetical protein n=1 Tax=Methylococcus sp. EFPC2 TaxID=2812648 RepID=UPI0019673A54|nr:hypothetical protein [Methylococcus sp. EFPC2]QSA96302.1 hypothetical protein JWZ97_13875 [Methylococcus sp. EFPC2]
MKWFPFFRKNPRRSERAGRYQQLRKAGRELNAVLAKQVPKTAIGECGKKLGIYKAGNLILNNDDEIAILFDYAIHHYRRGGKTVIERYLEQSPPEPGSDAATLLQAMQQSRYSVFRVVEIEPNQGARLHDLLRGDSLDLMDLGLAATGTPGVVLAGMVLPLDDFHISSGSLIPLPEGVFEEKILPVADKFMAADADGTRPVLSPAQAASFAAQVIRIALYAGGEDNTFYTDIEPSYD